jgi:hypothetical protein
LDQGRPAIRAADALIGATAKEKAVGFPPPFFLSALPFGMNSQFIGAKLASCCRQMPIKRFLRKITKNQSL